MYGEGAPASTSARSAREVVLVVENDELSRQRLGRFLRTPARDVFVASTARDGVAALKHNPLVVLVSLDLPDALGVRAIELFREAAPDVPVIATTGGLLDVARAVAAVRHGAWDAVSVREAPDRLLASIAAVTEENRTRGQIAKTTEQNADRYGISQMLTQSPRMLEVFDQIRAVAPTDATVLVLGETGSGKELVSKAIHDRSRRKDKPLVATNCGAFTETLLESELFGHEKGAFTGAVGTRQGLFEMADGGTLFLDELGETTLNTQVNLLRVLEEMRFRRVGGRDIVHVDVRIVAATNVNLLTAVKDGKFRADLYYRLNVYPIRIPPLRERREDIPLLMRHFLDEFAESYAMEAPSIAPDAIQAILQYDWPGNVRQLRAMCERWVIRHHGSRVEHDHLGVEMVGTSARSRESIEVDERLTLRENVDPVVAQIERAYLAKIMRKVGGNVEQAAEASGIARRTMYFKMKEHGFDPKDFRGR